MNASELNSLEVNKVVDARGTACPGPLLEAKRAMADVPKNGGILEVLSSDEGKKFQHEYLGTIVEAGYWRIFVRRGKR
jgi:tRNA 2-thiouridine synthesizing protein A